VRLRLLLVAATLLLPAPLLAQAADGAVLRGIVLDETGAPSAGVPVALHRITDAGGGLVENATSDEAGRFELRLADEALDAVYFVAARYREELYIGPTFRPPFPEASDYVVQVGLEEASASALLRGTDVTIAPPPSPWRWALLGVLILAFLIGAAVLVRRVVGPAPRRRLLIRIAELDEALAGSDDQAETDARQLERDRLFERLRTAE
jgi:hypothetical protein